MSINNNSVKQVQFAKIMNIQLTGTNSFVRTTVRAEYHGHRTTLAPSYVCSGHPYYPCNDRVAPSWMSAAGSHDHLCYQHNKLKLSSFHCQEIVLINAL